MAFRISVAILLVISLTGNHVQSAEVLLTFDAAPTFDIPQFGGSVLDLVDGEWGAQEDGIDNNVENDPFGPTPQPVWNPGGWIQPVGTEAPDNNRGPVGPNFEGLDVFAIKANIFTGVIVYNGSSWGDVSTATHITMDVKGSFAGSGGITVLVSHSDGIQAATDNDCSPGCGPWWSWGAAASDASVGANVGDVTEWTTLLIPINRPDFQTDGNPPPEPGEAGAGGNWGTWGDFDKWDNVFADVNAIQITGVTPDTQIDNLGFVLPDVGSPGDFDGDSDVDGADFLEWQRNTSVGNLSDWQTNYGNSALSATVSAVPEPTSVLLLVVGSLLSLLGNRRSQSY